MNRILATTFLLVFFAMPAFARDDIEQRKIEYLIVTVADLGDATFIRNGQEYDAGHAAAHMRLKLRYAGDRVKTAQDFIVYCATGSSMSGVPYSIRFHDGRSVESATFLRGKLAEYEKRAATGGH